METSDILKITANGFLMGSTLTLLVLFELFIYLGFTPDTFQNEAVKHNAAEYYLDENHVRQFRWLDEKPLE